MRIHAGHKRESPTPLRADRAFRVVSRRVGRACLHPEAHLDQARAALDESVDTPRTCARSHRSTAWGALELEDGRQVDELRRDVRRLIGRRRP